MERERERERESESESKSEREVGENYFDRGMERNG